MEIGYIAVSGAIILYGTYPVFIKNSLVENKNIYPILLQFYYALSVFVLSLPTLAKIDLPIDVETFISGSISGCIWVIANCFSFIAIKHIGMAISVSIWAGISVLVSFAWGIIVFPESNKFNMIYGGISIGLLVIGVTTISIPSYISSDKTRKNKIIGTVCAIIMGLFNGSLFVPFQYLSQRDTSEVSQLDGSEIAFLFPFAISSLTISIFLLIFTLCIKRSLIKFPGIGASLLVLASGSLLLFGTVCSIYAVAFLGISIGVPLTQLSLIICGIWGIFIFNEITGWRGIIIWCISASILLAGSGLLAYAHE